MSIAAFPQTASVTPAGDFIWPCQYGEGGMTLRDYFAAKAMQGWLTTYGENASFPREKYRDQTAQDCYEMADAMLVARDKATSPVAESEAPKC